jgi:hypothetical protein
VTKPFALLAAISLALSLSFVAFANDAPPPSETTATSTDQTTDAPSEPAPPATEAKQAAAPAAATQPSTGMTANAAADDKLADDPVVCKRVQVTGSRVRKTKVCRPESEWRRTAEEAQAMMKKIERKSSPGVGGETLQPGG